MYDDEEFNILARKVITDRDFVVSSSSYRCHCLLVLMSSFRPLVIFLFLLSSCRHLTLLLVSYYRIVSCLSCLFQFLPFWIHYFHPATVLVLLCFDLTGGKNAVETSSTCSYELNLRQVQFII
jgi:hypothetical protein